jgi:hypothetical protein
MHSVQVSAVRGFLQGLNFSDADIKKVGICTSAAHCCVHTKSDGSAWKGQQQLQLRALHEITKGTDVLRPNASPAPI